MNHQSFLRGLSTEQRIALTRKTNRHGLIRLCVQVCLIAVTGAAIIQQVPGWPVLMIVQGTLLVFLFTLMHETSHWTVFRARWLNLWVSYVCGLVICLPATWFRYFHMAHHRYTQDPEKDPEIATPRPQTLWQYLAYISGLPIYRFHVSTVLRNALGRCRESYIPARQRKLVTREARMMVAFYALTAAVAIALGLTEILFVWLIPLLLGQPFLRAYLLAEHGQCPFVSDMFANTRTTFTNRLIRWLAWNMPYHAEHHAYPTVPFHRLPDLHRLAAPHLQVTAQGYARFNRAYAIDL